MANSKKQTEMKNLKVGDVVKIIRGYHYSGNKHKRPFVGEYQLAGVYHIDDLNKTAILYIGNNLKYLIHNDETFEYEKVSSDKPTWRKIDPNNLPIGIVATTNRNVSNPVFYVGVLHKDENGAYLNIMGGGVVSESTHYIPLSDLLNLPIEA